MNHIRRKLSALLLALALSLTLSVPALAAEEGKGLSETAREAASAAMTYHSGLVVLPEYGLSAAVLSSGGVSVYNEMAASQMLVAALREQGVEVDETPLTLPQAAPVAMPRELSELSGYYASLYVYKVNVTADGKLTMHYLNMPGVPDQTFAYYSDGSFRNETNTAALRVVNEDNGQTYLYQWAFTSLPGLGGLPTSNYAAVRLPENEIKPELQTEWNTLIGKAVLPMNERYSSQVYLALGALLQAEQGDTEDVPGYVGTLRIEDANHARYIVQLPGNAGRDGSDIELRRDEKGNVWYYQSNGAVYMDMAAVPDLPIGKDNRAACTVQPDGYVQWYRIGDNAAGKTMTVQMPEDAGYWVYDSEGTVAASSVLGSGPSAKLPEGGLIVFAGDPGVKFQLSFH